ncbi:MAG: tetratricopeptide repeat protein [Candidatus Eremiobacteraeota bacterium]|nr:tetratricopeptide repeat protein [Candidatus Eremiobacteraeota bacterium]
MRRLLVLFTLLSLPVWARYAVQPTEPVPVARLVANLHKQIEANPKDGQAHYALARVHSMAYAYRATSIEVEKESRGSLPDFARAHEPPAGVKPGKDLTSAQALKHLERAIVHYRKAVALLPDHLTAHLGLAWCLEQAGRKQQAIEEYRKVFAAAYDKEHERYFGQSLTLETGGYLVPLLDPNQDAAEIASLKKKMKVVQQAPRAVTPILIGLEGENLEDLTLPAARVAFDLDGTGLTQQWPWITPRAAWLVYDPNRSGDIHTGLQLFGSVTFWVAWDNGYQALAALDDNLDGRLDGPELEGLALWRDRNGDGLSQPGEVKPLADYGIVALFTDWQVHATGIPYAPTGVLWQDGRRTSSYDWVVEARMPGMMR